MAELLTDKQKERREIDVYLSGIYKRMREEFPKASRSLIIKEMAQRSTCGIRSISGIRSSLLRTGTIEAGV